MMSLIEVLPEALQWLWKSWHARPADEIDDELMFHLRSLVDANLARGMSFDAAWADAEKRFGSLRRYAEDCRQVSSTERVLFQALPVAGLLVVAALVSWLLIEVRALKRDQSAMLAARPLQSATQNVGFAEQSAAKPKAGAKPTNLTGSVVDRQGRPIDDATVLVILKTWPGGRYRQENFTAKSDKHGKFSLPKLVPAEGQVAVQIAAVREGCTLTSHYEVREASVQDPIAPIELVCEAAPRLTLMVRDAAGQVAAKARIAPMSRRAADGAQHTVYFQGSDPIHLMTDAKGQAKIGCFQRGDQAEVYVRLPGYDWEQYTIAIPTDGDTIEISAKETLLAAEVN